MFSLQGRTAVLTGSTGFFGRAFANTLLRAGAKVLLFGRSDSTRAMRESLAAAYGPERVAEYVVDCADEPAFRDSLGAAVASHPRIDVLVNNAFEFSRATGFNDPSGRLDAISKEQWMRGLESGIVWQASAIQALAPAMRAAGGSIINISSMYAIVAPDPKLYEGKQALNPPVYGAAKAGLLALTRYVASFYGASGIRCNALLPGPFPNTDTSAFNAPPDEAFLSVLAGKTVLGRVGRVEELEGPLLFLASDASRYVTGHGLVVDGGWTIR